MELSPDMGERLTDAEINKIEREGIEYCDDLKKNGQSDMYDAAQDRRRMSTRKSFYFEVPWKKEQ